MREDRVEFAPSDLGSSDPGSRAARWATDNAEAIEDYNRRIRERGVFSDGLRTW
jgi:post-segregation antitoxin (ccd killing protein)